MNRELFLRLQEKKRIYRLGKKGRATRKGYKEVVKMRREKSREAKAQLELNLAAGVGKKERETLLQIHQQKEEDQGESPFLTG